MWRYTISLYKHERRDQVHYTDLRGQSLNFIKDTSPRVSGKMGGQALGCFGVNEKLVTQHKPSISCCKSATRVGERLELNIGLC